MKQMMRLLLISGLLVIGRPALAQDAHTLLRGPQVAKQIRRQVILQEKRARQASRGWGSLQAADRTISMERSVFLPHAALGGEPFSGGVFEINYDGKKEIFGFVAAHVLADEPSCWIEKIEGSWQLKRTFEVEIAGRRIPAEVVQLSSPRMLDVVLVKFRPEDEKLFIPFSLRQAPVKNGEELGFYGFSDRGGVFLHRRVLFQTPLSLRTDMHYPRNGRPGFCGGALFDAAGQLVGIHTGSNREIDQFDDIGYATHARFLTTLVKAYHNGGKATFPLELDGKKVIDLAANEYVSVIEAFSKSGARIGVQTVPFKFSYTALKKLIETSHPRYLQFFIGQMNWAPKDPQYVQDRSGLHQVVYDLKKQRVVSKVLE